MSKHLTAFGATLRKRREALGHSQEEFARLAQVDRTYVSGCERGIRNPTILVLWRLANALGCHPAELIGGRSPK